MKKRILVTGATGFTGGHLCRSLLESGETVKVLVRRSSNYGELAEKGCEIVFGDLSTGEGIREAVMNTDVVYHIGAAFRVEGVPLRYFHAVNVDGTRKLLDAALEYGVRRFVHCSTVGVHGEISNPPADEDAPFRPGDHYQKSKLKGELSALEYYKQGLGVVIFRPFGMYGPGDMRFLKLFRPISRGRWFVVGKARNLYQLTYIDDLVRGIRLCGEVEGIEGQVFILGGAQYSTVEELGQMIAKSLGIKLKIIHLPVLPVWVAAWLCEAVCRPLGIAPPLYRRRLDFFLKDRAFDISKAKRVLGYEPRVSLYEGVMITAKWYKKMGLL
jgi:nucleoside-diphosphate-sugar epimerase